MCFVANSVITRRHFMKKRYKGRKGSNVIKKQQQVLHSWNNWATIKINWIICLHSLNETGDSNKHCMQYTQQQNIVLIMIIGSTVCFETNYTFNGLWTLLLTDTCLVMYAWYKVQLITIINFNHIFIWMR